MPYNEGKEKTQDVCDHLFRKDEELKGIYDGDQDVLYGVDFKNCKTFF